MRWLVTGGVGFIGTNLVTHLVETGNDVVIIDDMSRIGVDLNAKFLKEKLGIKPNKIDVSRNDDLLTFFRTQSKFDVIAHLAGQVSLLESINDPMRDFAINAQGTLNILNHIRMTSDETIVLGMSSNKLYGDLNKIRFSETDTRYVATEWPNGFNESLPLDFHGPYGCSKGVADQYLADFSRTYGLRTASLRQSSVYGPHQHPRSDQGWVTHLVTEAINGREIQLNGIGKQVRDLLHAVDLAKLFVLLAENVQAFSTHQLNVGGGQSNSLSILELFSRLEQTLGIKVLFKTGPERPSDQKVFISDNSAVTALTGWQPEINLDFGLSQLVESVQSKKHTV